MRWSFVLDIVDAVELDSERQWFQWLAERMTERESRATPVPAHLEHS